MSWLGIVLTWIVLSIAVPMLYSWRYHSVKNYRARAFEARAKLHLFHFRQDFSA